VDRVTQTEHDSRNDRFLSTLHTALRSNMFRTSDTSSEVLATSSLGGTSKAPAMARLLGSACSGIFELAVFHPVDTVAKRLMSNKGAVNNLAGVNAVIFPKLAQSSNISLARRWASLYPGLGFASGYKISQRTYKFAGQPFAKDIINANLGTKFDRAFGDNSKTMQHAVAGSMVGIGEVALLPLDALKIKAQTNPEVLQGRGFFNLVRTEGFALYRGWNWTMFRNAPGLFALFGGNAAYAAVKDHVFDLPDHSKASFFQNFCASIGGAVASITVAAPTDVIKTRIQNRAFDSPASGISIIRDLLRNEGPGAFFKGLLPKIIVVGPKLVFSFTCAQTLIGVFARSGAFGSQH